MNLILSCSCGHSPPHYPHGTGPLSHTTVLSFSAFHTQSGKLEVRAKPLAWLSTVPGQSLSCNKDQARHGYEQAQAHHHTGGRWDQKERRSQKEKLIRDAPEGKLAAPGVQTEKSQRGSGRSWRPGLQRAPPLRSSRGCERGLRCAQLSAGGPAAPSPDWAQSSKGNMAYIPEGLRHFLYCFQKCH